MKIAILGFARDGKAAYDFFLASGHTDITICDQNEQTEMPVAAKKQLGANYLQNLDQYDTILRTAGLHPNLIQKANPNSPNILDKVTGNIDLFYENCPTKNIIGVTGTKGKGTTSTLITKMLEVAFAGRQKVYLGGNIGISALELLKNAVHEDDWIVLEQSSFQLIDQKHSPHIAVCLMVVPEHLDWHTDLDEYITAKSQLFIHQSTDDTAIYYADNQQSKDIASCSGGKLVPFYAPPGAVVVNNKIQIDGQTICSTDQIKLPGKHNRQNVCAAVTAVWFSLSPVERQITQNKEAIYQVLSSFTGLEHRLELVREFKGVKYYDDSFGTTPETAIVAIQTFDAPKIVILGGSDKGASYDKLADTINANNVRHVLTIGQTGPSIETTLKQRGYDSVSHSGNSMKEMVANAQELAEIGDVVLLSPACASFGLFKDYKDRGEQFKKAVLAL